MPEKMIQKNKEQNNAQPKGRQHYTNRSCMVQLKTYLPF